MDVRNGLARERLASLYSGLLGLEKRMTVFTAAADDCEAGNQTGAFIFGGWVAPATEWLDYFTPAWEEWVLNEEPRIDSFHTTELNSADGAARLGLSVEQAQSRINTACHMIRLMGRLHPVVSQIDDGQYFRNKFAGIQVVQPGPQPGAYPFDPDYYAFLGYVVTALTYINTAHPDAKQVDFVVEKKDKITHRLGHFYERLSEVLPQIGAGHLVRYLGEFNPGSKTLTTMQAADLLLWHVRTVDSGKGHHIDERRLFWMLNGRPVWTRRFGTDTIDAFKERADKNPAPSPFTPKGVASFDGV